MKKIIQLTALFLTAGSFLVFETLPGEAKSGGRGLRVFDDIQNGNSNRSNRNSNVNRNSNGNSHGNSNFNGSDANRGDDDGHRRGRRGRRGRGRD